MNCIHFSSYITGGTIWETFRELIIWFIFFSNNKDSWCWILMLLLLNLLGSLICYCLSLIRNFQSFFLKHRECNMVALSFMGIIEFYSPPISCLFCLFWWDWWSDSGKGKSLLGLMICQVKLVFSFFLSLGLQYWPLAYQEKGILIFVLIRHVG